MSTRPVVALLLGLPTVAAAQRPLNLGFETSSVAYAHQPWGWTTGWSAFAGGPAAAFALDSVVRVEGTRSLRIETRDTGADAPVRSTMMQAAASPVLGKAVVLSGRVRVVGTGRAAVVLAMWGRDSTLAGDSTTIAAPSGQAAWVPFRLTMRVPADSTIHTLVVSVGGQGAVTAWFDAFQLTVAGRKISAMPPLALPPTAGDIAWLRARTAPLFRTEWAPGDTGDTDLALFDRIVGNARIVGLGESTHGTREFFQFKHRALEHLVRTRDFTVFAVEANQMAVRRLNAFVLGDSGTSAQAMRVMFAVWNTEEMQALVEWMREYNRAHRDRPVYFIGYDMQDQRAPADTLLSFLQRRDTPLAARATALTADYRAERSYATPQVAPGTRALWAARAESLWTEVAMRRTAWLGASRSGADTVDALWAVQAANLYRQAARFNVLLNSPERDSLMAANLDWALTTLHPGSRAVVWAHDVHVSHGGHTTLSFNAGAQMGAFLKRTHGDAYRSFTLLTVDGTYSATRSFTDHQMFAAQGFRAPIASVEASLAAVRTPPGSVGLIADMRGVGDDPRGAWLMRPRPIRHIGYAAYDYGFDLLAMLPLEFDGAVLVRRTEASRMLR